MTVQCGPPKRLMSNLLPSRTRPATTAPTITYVLLLPSSTPRSDTCQPCVDQTSTSISQLRVKLLVLVLLLAFSESRSAEDEELAPAPALALTLECSRRVRKRRRSGRALPHFMTVGCTVVTTVEDPEASVVTEVTVACTVVLTLVGVGSG